MGWNTYYGLGASFDENTILSVAQSLINRGLANAGYRIVWLDFGWASGQRDRCGQLIVNPHQWPHGLAWLTGWLHQHGLLAGIYTDAGYSGCDGQGVGSRGHYQQDVDTFAAWGFDAVKVDFCGAGQERLDPRLAYEQFADAISHNSSGRPMLLNVCNFWTPGQIAQSNPSYDDSAFASYRWGSLVAQSWRTDTDIGFPGIVTFDDVLRNLDNDATHPQAAGPGHWNDPDYLAPQLGMTSSQTQAQLSMWAMTAAPLILGSDPRVLSQQTIDLLENQPVLAVDQDALGVQGTPIAQEGNGQVWRKPLVGGAQAVALLNRGPTPIPITTTAAAVGLPSAPAYHLQNLWAGSSTTTTATIAAVVPADSAVLYRVTTTHSPTPPATPPTARHHQPATTQQSAGEPQTKAQRSQPQQSAPRPHQPARHSRGHAGTGLAPHTAGGQSATGSTPQPESRQPSGATSSGGQKTSDPAPSNAPPQPTVGDSGTPPGTGSQPSVSSTAGDADQPNGTPSLQAANPPNANASSPAQSPADANAMGLTAPAAAMPAAAQGITIQIGGAEKSGPASETSRAASSGCWDWAVWEIETNLVGDTVAKWEDPDVYWCANGATVTSLGPDNPEGFTYLPGWSYRGQTSYSDVGGVGGRYWTHDTHGSFCFLDTAVAGCTQAWYPAFQTQAWGNGGLWFNGKWLAYG